MIEEYSSDLVTESPYGAVDAEISKFQEIKMKNVAEICAFKLFLG